jgi:hypothetical protein
MYGGMGMMGTIVSLIKGRYGGMGMMGRGMGNGNT